MISIPLYLFDTHTRSLQHVTPQDGKTVRLYTCGPTVYDFAHIGNFRTFMFEDILRRTIRFLGMQVLQVMNLTDVDDKTIRGALAKGISLDAYTQQYKQAFFEDLGILGIERAEHYPEATKYIAEMIEMCQELIAKKVAYIGSDKSVYFAIDKFPEYGKLSHLKLDELKQGASERSNQDEYGKESASDFVLWKAHDPSRDGEIYWDSPFGPGRPGWHIECSVMAHELLGTTIDIHAGGVDLIFPHHENEIAQSESCSGRCFAKIWVHSEHLLVDGKKMSKSLGNFYTLRDLLQKGYSGKVIRLLLLQTHYRTQLNFTFQGLEAAKAACQRIYDFITRLEAYQSTSEKEYGAHMALEAFAKALANDLNVSEALSVLFDMIRHVNGLCDADQISTRSAKAVLDVIRQMDSVLGICSADHEAIPEEIQKLSRERLQARAERNWKRSDELRAQILERGYTIEDTATGVRIKRNSV